MHDEAAGDVDVIRQLPHLPDDVVARLKAADGVVQPGQTGADDPGIVNTPGRKSGLDKRQKKSIMKF